MKNKLILTGLAFAMILAACDRVPDKTTGTKISNLEDTTTQCYYYINKTDTVALHFRVTGGVMTGTLDYIFSEKDNNHGTIKGHMNGDTLIADYTFQSEGRESVREVAFLKTGDNFTEGFGEMQDVNNRLCFIDHRNLNFKSEVVLKKMNCN